MFSQIARINDHLYLSSLAALTPTRLQQHGVTQVISAMVEVLPPELLAEGGRRTRSHVQICVEDIESADLSVHFDSVADRIAREARRGGRSLVHCVAGVSRSPSLVLAYLVKHSSMTLAEAYDHLRRLRPCIRPNPGFWRQLIKYEVERRGVPSVCVEGSLRIVLQIHGLYRVTVINGTDTFMENIDSQQQQQVQPTEDKL
ncbi:Dual specificity protein phosphatase [Echinococcus granulosus]|uniref:Dual specificity protein phosphatase n=1 Tax=Echinococcus granulosus TaxID=6210 RepID=W6UA33_ECHGR|nr:Dual specificity protein phosphatase [Echinococcus granulosus]EUB55337.1 Dual specificity protein phosphatase [Echinococcus granulosus]